MMAITVYARIQTRDDCFELVEHADGTTGTWSVRKGKWLARFGLGTSCAGFVAAILDTQKKHLTGNGRKWITDRCRQGSTK